MEAYGGLWEVPGMWGCFFWLPACQPAFRPVYSPTAASSPTHWQA
jgi:hypothetical protein